jgi:tripartite-type tricarboxylate transporter receptor subunit TctC
MVRAANFAVLALAASQALAQAYPTRPIKVIVPVPPGAGVDNIIRKAGVDLLPRLGQPLVTENHESANMALGPQVCARMAPDGYALCVVNPLPMSYNPHTISNLAYNPERDFRPVVNMFFLREGIFAKAELPVSSVDDLRKYAVANPGKLNFGTLGPGSQVDISRMYINQKWSTEMVGIPYKGGPLILQALAGGQIDVARIGVYNGIGLIKAGKIKLLAIAGSKRSPLLPNVPTFEEVSMADVPPGGAWWGIVVPTGTPDPIIRRLNAEFIRLFREPGFVQYLDGQFIEVSAPWTPEEFGDFMRKDREKAGLLVRQYNIPKS